MKDRNPPEAVVSRTQDFRQIRLPLSNQGLTFAVRYDRNAPRKPPYRLRPRQHLWADARRPDRPASRPDLPGRRWYGLSTGSRSGQFYSVRHRRILSRLWASLFVEQIDVVGEGYDGSEPGADALRVAFGIDVEIVAT